MAVVTTISTVKFVPFFFVNTPGVTLGSLGVVMLDERLFLIASAEADHPLTELKAKGVEFSKEPKKEFYGIEALFKDDSGNWFSLGQRK